MQEPHKIRALVVTWPGEGSEALNTDAEVKAILAAQSSAQVSRMQIEHLHEPSLESLAQALRSFAPQVLHISAHGDPNGRLHVKKDGTYGTVGAADLCALIGEAHRALPIVVLNACFSDTLAEQMLTVAQVVVGSEVSVDDSAARSFAALLYGVLADGEDIESALSIAQAGARAATPSMPGRFRLTHRQDLDPAELLLQGDPAPSPGWRPAVPQRAATGRPVTQLILCLDAYTTDFPISDAQARIGELGETVVAKKTLYLSKQGIVPISGKVPKSSIDWGAMTRGVQQLVGAARFFTPEPGSTLQVFVCGYAPLPLFALLGFELNRWTAQVFVVHPTGARWDIMPANALGLPSRPYFDLTQDTVDSDAPGGRVAVYIDNRKTAPGVPLNKGQLATFAKNWPHADGRAHYSVWVERRHTQNEDMNANNASRIAKELSDSLSALTQYGNSYDLFLACAAPVAFMAGLAINRNIFRQIRVPEFDAGAYLPAVVLAG